MDNFKMSSKSIPRYFDPTAATASMFLYAQGNSVVCCHHDTLTIERRFTRHSDEVQILAVDTQSELGAGRLVVSYDSGQTAIVWDIMSGEEVARFASYEHLTAAAWMKNGNVAFGEWIQTMLKITTNINSPRQHSGQHHALRADDVGTHLCQDD